MTTWIEYVGVFVCGLLLGVAGAIQIAELLGVLPTQAAPARAESASLAVAQEVSVETESLRRPARTLKRRTPWRKVKARYEAEHRRTRERVEERVQEMEQL